MTIFLRLISVMAIVTAFIFASYRGPIYLLSVVPLVGLFHGIVILYMNNGHTTHVQGHRVFSGDLSMLLSFYVIPFIIILVIGGPTHPPLFELGYTKINDVYFENEMQRFHVNASTQGIVITLYLVSSWMMLVAMAIRHKLYFSIFHAKFGRIMAIRHIPLSIFLIIPYISVLFLFHKERYDYGLIDQVFDTMVLSTFFYLIFISVLAWFNPISAPRTAQGS